MSATGRRREFPILSDCQRQGHDHEGMLRSCSMHMPQALLQHAAGINVCRSSRCIAFPNPRKSSMWTHDCTCRKNMQQDASFLSSTAAYASRIRIGMKRNFTGLAITLATATGVVKAEHAKSKDVTQSVAKCPFCVKPRMLHNPSLTDMPAILHDSHSTCFCKEGGACEC